MSNCVGSIFSTWNPVMIIPGAGASMFMLLGLLTKNNYLYIPMGACALLFILGACSSLSGEWSLRDCFKDTTRVSNTEDVDVPEIEATQGMSM